MKAIILTLLLLVGIAGSVWTTSLKKEITSEQEQRLENLDLNANVEDQIDKVDTEIKDETQKLKDARLELAEAEQRLSQVNGEMKSLQRKLATINNRIDSAEASTAEVDESVEKLKNEFAEVPIGGGIDFDMQGFDAESVVETLRKKLSGQIDTLKTDISEQEELIANATQAVKQNRSEIDRLTTKKQQRDSRVARNAIESVITAVDNNWGFVVIGAGRNSGFTPQSRLLVKRDGRIIGEIQPTSIEASQTIANIDPETIAPGVMIQRGDQVIQQNVEANNN